MIGHDVITEAGNAAIGNANTNGCPVWCIEAHIDEHPDERTHSTWIQAVDLSALPLPGLLQRLWLDLLLEPRKDEPCIRLHIDDSFVAELTVAEARDIGIRLIGLATLADIEAPVPSPARL
ncbi:hypothetical protein AB0C10_32495 [Microbispora amethystogenes]|uniref:DUF6907 domain-containing protein n=1 Tax=Microbispora amethystogenes TaxID=1427754 RepID=UPI0033F66C93